VPGTKQYPGSALTAGQSQEEQPVGAYASVATAIPAPSAMPMVIRTPTLQSVFRSCGSVITHRESTNARRVGVRRRVRRHHGPRAILEPVRRWFPWLAGQFCRSGAVPLPRASCRSRMHLGDSRHDGLCVDACGAEPPTRSEATLR